jgi:16S rRNA (guanine527-N7)-methyltransferase
MKSNGSDNEAKEAVNAAEKLAARFKPYMDYEIPLTGVTHRLIILEKSASTPKGYPRKFTKVSKSPLI